MTAKNPRKKLESEAGLEVAVRRLEEIVPYARNPRKNEAAVGKVMASLKEFGWRQPIVVDPEMVIVAGHTRYEAAKRLGWTTAPVHVAAGLTPAQIKAYRLADNRTGQEAEWDTELLGLELAELQVADFDVSLAGFDDKDLSSIFLERESGENDADAEWQGMPEFNQQDKTAHKQLTVNFATQANVNKFAETVGQAISERTRSIWFPAAVIETYADKSYDPE